jgi:hypothetical protein
VQLLPEYYEAGRLSGPVREQLVPITRLPVEQSELLAGASAETGLDVEI